jgi:hypothetical protein
MNLSLYWECFKKCVIPVVSLLTHNNKTTIRLHISEVHTEGNQYVLVVYNHEQASYYRT